MEQNFRQSLARYHELFDGGRCQGWELEELIVKAIKSDTTANHFVRWQEAGHDDEADIVAMTNGTAHQIQIKSGKISNNRDGEKILTLSGHRLGRFGGDLEDISNYLNQREANIISVPYRQQEGVEGRKHIYRLCYIPVEVMQGIDEEDWETIGAQHQAWNEYGVLFSLRPSMSWQIWWTIPLSILNPDREFTNGNFIEDG